MLQEGESQQIDGVSSFSYEEQINTSLFIKKEQIDDQSDQSMHSEE